MANKTCVVTSPDSKIGEDEFRKLTSTDSGKVYQVDTDGTVKLKSLTDQFVEKTSTGEVKIENEIKFDNEVKIESKNGTAINTNNDIIELKCSDIILGTPELQLLDLQLPNDNIALSLIGGDELASSPSLTLFGNTSSSNAGEFNLSAANTTSSATLNGTPTGTLTWNGKDIALSENVLSLSGGTLTGSISAPDGMTTPVIVGSSDLSKAVTVCGGTSMTDGGSLILFGSAFPQAGGAFCLMASKPSESQTSSLMGFANGVLRWNINNKSRDIAFSTLEANTSCNTICGGTNETQGASLELYGCESTENAGYFKLRACNSDIPMFSPSVLKGDTAGFLTWKIGDYDEQEVMFKTTTKWMDGGQNGFYACKSSLDGAYIFAYGIGATGNEGQFILGATDKTTKSHVELIGKPDGKLIWNGSEVATSANVLPLSGGTMTGSIIAPAADETPVIVNSANNKILYILGGATPQAGAALGLCGTNMGEFKGCFLLQASTSSEAYCNLIGTPSGDLYWSVNGGDAQEIALKNMAVDTGSNIIFGGTNEKNGGTLQLNGESSSTDAGSFILKAVKEGSSTCTLKGNVDGTLTWNDKSIVNYEPEEFTPTALSGYAFMDVSSNCFKVGKVVYINFAAQMAAGSVAKSNTEFLDMKYKPTVTYARMTFIKVTEGAAAGGGDVYGSNGYFRMYDMTIPQYGWFQITGTYITND